MEDVFGGSFKEILRGLITCSICLEIYDKPKTLSCLHTLCEKHVPSMLKGLDIECHMCRKKTKMESVQQDFRTQNLIELFYKDFSKNFCSVHAKEEVKGFCFTDKLPICFICVAKNHKNHNWMPLDDAAKLIKGEIQRALENYDSKCSQAVDKNQEKAMSGQNTSFIVETHAHRIRSAIGLHFQNIGKALNQRKEDLIKEISKWEKSTLSSLTKQADAIATFQSHADATKNVAQLVANSTDLDIVTRGTSILEQLEKVPQIDIPELRELKFIEAELQTDEILIMIQNIGIVSYRTEKTSEIAPKAVQWPAPLPHTNNEAKVEPKIPSLNPAKVEVSEVVSVEPTKPIPADIMNMSWQYCFGNSKEYRLENPYAITFVAKYQKYLVCEKQKVQVFDVNMRWERNFTSYDFSQPLGITCNNENEVLVCDSKECKIVAFDINGQYLYSFGHKGQQTGCLMNPRGICVDSKNRVIVADRGNDRVVVFYKQKHLETISGNMSLPCGVAAHPSLDLIYVSDTENNRILIFTVKGAKKMTIEGGLNHPVGILVTEDYVLVSDMDNHRLCIFDASGVNLLKTFGKKGGHKDCFKNPTQLGMGPNNSILISDYWNHRICVFGNKM